MVSSADRLTMMGEFLVPLKWVGRTSVDYDEVTVSFCDVRCSQKYHVCEGTLHNKIKWSIFKNSLRISQKKLQWYSWRADRISFADVKRQLTKWVDRCNQDCLESKVLCEVSNGVSHTLEDTFVCLAKSKLNL